MFSEEKRGNISRFNKKLLILDQAFIFKYAFPKVMHCYIAFYFLQFPFKLPSEIATDFNNISFHIFRRFFVDFFDNNVHKYKLSCS